jgi:hypothetical protein
MRFTTTVKVWQATGGVEGVFDPLLATWNLRFEARAFVEPLGDGTVKTLFADMRAEGARIWLDGAHPEMGFRWLIKDAGDGTFYLVEPASPRHYATGIRHLEINARRLLMGPLGL